MTDAEHDEIEQRMLDAVRRYCRGERRVSALIREISAIDREMLLAEPTPDQILALKASRSRFAGELSLLELELDRSGFRGGR